MKIDLLILDKLQINDGPAYKGEMIPLLHLVKQVSRSSKKGELANLKSYIPDSWASELLGMMLAGPLPKKVKRNYFILRVDVEGEKGDDVSV